MKLQSTDTYDDDVPLEEASLSYTSVNNGFQAEIVCHHDESYTTIRLSRWSARKLAKALTDFCIDAPCH